MSTFCTVPISMGIPLADTKRHEDYGDWLRVALNEVSAIYRLIIPSPCGVGRRASAPDRRRHHPRAPRFAPPWKQSVRVPRQGARTRFAVVARSRRGGPRLDW